MTAAAWSHGNYSNIESRIPTDSSYRGSGKGAGFGERPFGGSGYSNRQYVKYVPVGYADTHSKTLGYLFWLIGFTGAHRFYYGRPLTGVLWFFTFGLFGIGWLVDFFLIPSMDHEADQQFMAGAIDYNLPWLLLVFAGAFGLHRFAQGRWGTGLVYLLTFGLCGIGVIYDVLTMNDQINARNHLAF